MIPHSQAPAMIVHDQSMPSTFELYEIVREMFTIPIAIAFILECLTCSDRGEDKNFEGSISRSGDMVTHTSCIAK